MIILRSADKKAIELSEEEARDISTALRELKHDRIRAEAPIPRIGILKLQEYINEIQKLFQP